MKEPAFIRIKEFDAFTQSSANDIARQEEQLRIVFDTMQAGILLISPQGIITFANQRMADMFRCPLEKLVHSSYLEHLHPDQRNVGEDRLRRLIAGEVDHVHHERCYIRKDGSRFWGHFNGRRLENDQGELISVVSVIADISETKRAEEELKKREQQFISLADNLPDVISRIDRSHRHVYVNRQVEAMTGISQSDYLGKTYRELGMPLELVELWEAAVNKVFETGQDEQICFSFETKTGTKHFESRIVPERNEGGAIDSVLSIARDITERKILQQEQEKAQRLFSLGVLAGGIAHDFNNILTGIIGNISLAAMLVGQEHKVAERLKNCQNAAHRAVDLTRQLLTFSRGGEPVRKTVSAARLIAEALTFCLRGSNVKGTFDCAHDLWLINADAGQISQVLNNLLINARQVMEAGGTVKLKAENCEIHTGDSKLLASGRYIRIIVEDAGSGIPPEELDHIFDPYFTTKEFGTGLGLTSVYSIVRRHDGQVEVSSVVGRGTTFTIYLPALTDTDEEAPVQEHEASFLQGSGRILVMDDEEIIRNLAVVMLKEAGYEVESCSDGAVAVDRFNQAKAEGNPFDVVILDLTVPGGMGGKEAAARIREHDRKVALIVSSGYSNDPVIADFHSYGFSAAVAKPYTVGSLTGEVSRILTGR